MPKVREVIDTTLEEDLDEDLVEFMNLREWTLACRVRFTCGPGSHAMVLA
jgi:hypothetical protein